MSRRFWTGILLAALSVGCAKEAGEACEATGDGFTRRDPCEFTCVEWEIDCADGSTVTPGVCSAGECGTDVDCPEGFSCVAIGSFATECLPDDTCDGGS
jgi:hypothetical protein